MASVLLEADHLRKSFGPRQLLDLDHLSVYDGEKIGLIGENGAGKKRKRMKARYAVRVRSLLSVSRGRKMAKRMIRCRLFSVSVPAGTGSPAGK